MSRSFAPRKDISLSTTKKSRKEALIDKALTLAIEIIRLLSVVLS